MARGATVAIAALVATGLPAHAKPPTVATLDDFARTTGRMVDQVLNLDYQQRMLPQELAVAPLAALSVAGQPAPGYIDANAAYFTDPFLLDWAPTHGRHLKLSYPNRYGATIRGHLFAPASGSGPFPGIVFVPGIGSWGEFHIGTAQNLAERGYVVLLFDPQGQGKSDYQPAPEFCLPGAWQQPQEAGQVEQGSCAGVYPPPPAADPTSTALLDARLNREMPASVAQMYSIVGANFVLGALDAAGWLLSGANPWRSLVDDTRLGTIGHSLGAFGALVAANGDPQQRFSAAIALDGYGELPAVVDPTVPTMFQIAEQQESFGPYVDGGAVPTAPQATASRFRADGIDVAQIALRASTHAEWMYLPQRAIGAGFVPATPYISSRYGERVATHFALAWFDKYLGGQNADARLAGPTFTNEVDSVSRGSGTMDPLTLRNRPYRIAGEPYRRHLSRLYASYVDTETLACPQLRTGC